jgi:hypothetical protein
MKTNNKMIGSRMTQTALLLGVLLCAQNLKACVTTLPEVCADGFWTGDCNGDNPNGYADYYVTGAAFYDDCVDAGSHSFGTGSSCDPSPFTCTYTVHVDNCDGSSEDVPESFTSHTYTLVGTCQ